MICQDTMVRHRRFQPCAFPVKWVAKGPGYTKFVCGYHRRAYTRVVTVAAFADRG